ncbi:MAG: hypothetical protein V3U76_12855 [Granulosicoccus sp.]
MTKGLLTGLAISIVLAGCGDGGGDTGSFLQPGAQGPNVNPLAVAPDDQPQAPANQNPLQTGPATTPTAPTGSTTTPAEPTGPTTTPAGPAGQPTTPVGPTSSSSSPFSNGASAESLTNAWGCVINQQDEIDFVLVLLDDGSGAVGNSDESVDMIQWGQNSAGDLEFSVTGSDSTVFLNTRFDGNDAFYADAYVSNGTPLVANGADITVQCYRVDLPE